MSYQRMHETKKKFRIGDLAHELNIKKFVIRFWEKEFGLLSDRSEGGQRFYTEADLSLFRKIKELLYTQGFTIAGARQQLKSNSLSIATADQPIIEAKQETTIQEAEHVTQQAESITPSSMRDSTETLHQELMSLKHKLFEIRQRLE
jgi:DNA-binding transcriptional MerR regulator